MRVFLSLWRGPIPLARARPPEPLFDICQTVGDAYGVTMEEIRGPRGPRQLHPARFAFYHAAQRAGYSYPVIGRFCGGRDHSTVWDGVRRHAKRLSTDNHLCGVADPSLDGCADAG